LRAARAAKGLDLATASAQTEIPIEQLQDLESGTVDRLPDRVAILKALSRYAAFLDLPSDQFVMTLVEHWPTGAAGPAPVVVVHNGPATTATTEPPVSAPAAPLIPRAPADDLSAPVVSPPAPANGSRPTSIGVPAVGTPVLEGRHNTTAPVPTVMADTGVTPAVRRTVGDGLLMVFVRSLVVVAMILVAVGTAWLVINKVHPQGLADLRLPYTSHGAGGVGVATTPTPTLTTHATTPHPAIRASAPAMHLLSADASQASFSVSTPQFAVRISAQGGDTWVSASGPLSSQPDFQGIVKSGQSQLVTADHQLTVQIGSTAARVAVQVNSRVIGTYVPPGAPFTMTFTTP